MNLTINRDLKDALKPELLYLNQALENLSKESDGFLGDLLSYVLIGSGKRVRPTLVYLCSKLGSSRLEDVRVVEMAVELVHIATLIHDDVIDKAALRRGRKTVTDQHGVDTAVLLGDHVYTYAFQKVAELDQPLILKLLAESTSVMCGGEIEQLKRRFQFDFSGQEYFSFIKKKTAALFGASARTGSILAGQSLSNQKAVEQYGIHLGMAFQIVDDLLDLTGEEGIVGKTLRTDLLNGKMTLPLIHFQNSLPSSSERNNLLEILKNPNGQISDLISRVKTAGSLDYAEEIARQHIQLALAQLETLPLGDEREHLTHLAEMLHHRNA